MSRSIPTNNLPIRYINNGMITWGSATTLLVSNGQERDTTNTWDIENPVATINAAINGFNGLDTGSLAANTFYYVYVIRNTQGLPYKPTGYLLSTSATQPVLPAYYNIFSVIGIWPTDGSANLLKGYVSGNGNYRCMYYDTLQIAISAGASQTLAAITSLANFVPAIDNTPVLLQVAFTPAAAGNTVGLASGGSVATVLPSVRGQVAAVVASGYLKVPARLVTGVPVINYINSAAACATTVYVQGFEYFI